ncbi:hypothetical protein TRFO_43064 [Tritrichomonas foetus]|uniref:Uncharacterized protein n=1 Tax=Tritrichomonas foetus TaxID=1144522 RepID=A0A1J4KXV9_9EUKA|nr:hypothetical protein TRFO_43064 [Tritrichomonas foetus]|eukprot:OHT14397.1 hypothetical protein TRFO_43064 [Tritrichomonas foetus]
MKWSIQRNILIFLLVICYFYCLFSTLLLLKTKVLKIDFYTRSFRFKDKYVFVSGFFPVDKIGVRHKIEMYLLWIDWLVTNLKSELFFYTSINFSTYLKKYNQMSNFHLVLKYQNGYDVSYLRGKKRKYTDLYQKTRLSYRCTPEISGVWNAKMQFIYEVSSNHKEKWTFWLDAGYYRYKQFSEIIFPFHERFQFMNSSVNLLFITSYQFRLKKSTIMKWVQSETVLGGFFGGNYASILKLYELFVHVHDFFLNQNIYVGREELIFSTIFNFYNISAWIVPLFRKTNKQISKYFCAIPFFASKDICNFRSLELVPLKSFQTVH